MHDINCDCLTFHLTAFRNLKINAKYIQYGRKLNKAQFTTSAVFILSCRTGPSYRIRRFHYD